MLRSELHPRGLEIVTVSLELSGPEASRRYIEAAHPEHPSLLDPTHQLDALFGVVNIPNVIWIDEEGMIVRPPEPGWAGPQQMPEELMRAAAARAPGGRRLNLSALGGGQDRNSYPDALRDWVLKGRDSRFHLTPEQVVARSQPRPRAVSEAAAHFELANHLWTRGQREAAIAHWNACHRLQPDNWTYKRQAYSLLGNEQVGRRVRPLQPGSQARRGSELAVRVGLLQRDRQARAGPVLPEDPVAGNSLGPAIRPLRKDRARDGRQPRPRRIRWCAHSREHGADAIVVSRKLDACERVAAEVRALGRRALAVSAHCGKWDEIDALIETAYAEFGRVDILVNNAGMGPRVPSHEMTEELFDKIVGLNFKGPFRLASRIGQRMAEGRRRRDHQRVVHGRADAAPAGRALRIREGRAQRDDGVARARIRAQGAREHDLGRAVPDRHREGLGRERARAAAQCAGPARPARGDRHDRALPGFAGVDVHHGRADPRRRWTG